MPFQISREQSAELRQMLDQYLQTKAQRRDPDAAAFIERAGTLGDDPKVLGQYLRAGVNKLNQDYQSADPVARQMAPRIAQALGVYEKGGGGVVGPEVRPVEETPGEVGFWSGKGDDPSEVAARGGRERFAARAAYFQRNPEALAQRGEQSQRSYERMRNITQEEPVSMHADPGKLWSAAGRYAAAQTPLGLVGAHDWLNVDEARAELSPAQDAVVEAAGQAAGLASFGRAVNWIDPALQKIPGVGALMEKASKFAGRGLEKVGRSQEALTAARTLPRGAERTGKMLGARGAREVGAAQAALGTAGRALPTGAAMAGVGAGYQALTGGDVTGEGVLQGIAYPTAFSLLNARKGIAAARKPPPAAPVEGAPSAGTPPPSPGPAKPKPYVKPTVDSGKVSELPQAKFTIEQQDKNTIRLVQSVDPQTRAKLIDGKVDLADLFSSSQEKVELAHGEVMLADLSNPTIRGILRTKILANREAGKQTPEDTEMWVLLQGYEEMLNAQKRQVQVGDPGSAALRKHVADASRIQPGVIQWLRDTMLETDANGEPTVLAKNAAKQLLWIKAQAAQAANKADAADAKKAEQEAKKAAKAGGGGKPGPTTPGTPAAPSQAAQLIDQLLSKVPQGDNLQRKAILEKFIRERKALLRKTTRPAKIQTAKELIAEAERRLGEAAVTQADDAGPKEFYIVGQGGTISPPYTQAEANAKAAGMNARNPGNYAVQRGYVRDGRLVFEFQATQKAPSEAPVPEAAPAQRQAPATYLGLQKGIPGNPKFPDQHLWNLTEEITDVEGVKRPVGSTVTGKTLEEAGYTLPEIPSAVEKPETVKRTITESVPEPKPAERPTPPPTAGGKRIFSDEDVAFGIRDAEEAAATKSKDRSRDLEIAKGTTVTKRQAMSQGSITKVQRMLDNDLASSPLRAAADLHARIEANDISPEELVVLRDEIAGRLNEAEGVVKTPKVQDEGKLSLIPDVVKQGSGKEARSITNTKPGQGAGEFIFVKEVVKRALREGRISEEGTKDVQAVMRLRLIEMARLRRLRQVIDRLQRQDEWGTTQEAKFRIPSNPDGSFSVDSLRSVLPGATVTLQDGRELVIDPNTYDPRSTVTNTELRIGDEKIPLADLARNEEGDAYVTIRREALEDEFSPGQLEELLGLAESTSAGVYETKLPGGATIVGRVTSAQFDEKGQTTLRVIKGPADMMGKLVSVTVKPTDIYRDIPPDNIADLDKYLRTRSSKALGALSAYLAPPVRIGRPRPEDPWAGHRKALKSMRKMINDILVDRANGEPVNLSIDDIPSRREETSAFFLQLKNAREANIKWEAELERQLNTLAKAPVSEPSKGPIGERNFRRIVTEFATMWDLAVEEASRRPKLDIVPERTRIGTNALDALANRMAAIDPRELSHFLSRGVLVDAINQSGHTTAGSAIEIASHVAESAQEWRLSGSQPQRWADIIRQKPKVHKAEETGHDITVDELVEREIGTARDEIEPEEGVEAGVAIDSTAEPTADDTPASETTLTTVSNEPKRIKVGTPPNYLRQTMNMVLELHDQTGNVPADILRMVRTGMGLLHLEGGVRTAGRRERAVPWEQLDNAASRINQKLVNYLREQGKDADLRERTRGRATVPTAALNRELSALQELPQSFRDMVGKAPLETDQRPKFDKYPRPTTVGTAITRVLGKHSVRLRERTLREGGEGMVSARTQQVTELVNTATKAMANYERSRQQLLKRFQQAGAKLTVGMRRNRYGRMVPTVINERSVERVGTGKPRPEPDQTQLMQLAREAAAVEQEMNDTLAMVISDMQRAGINPSNVLLSHLDRYEPKPRPMVRPTPEALPERPPPLQEPAEGAIFSPDTTHSIRRIIMQEGEMRQLQPGQVVFRLAGRTKFENPMDVAQLRAAMKANPNLAGNLGKVVEEVVYHPDTVYVLSKEGDKVTRTRINKWLIDEETTDALNAEAVARSREAHEQASDEVDE